jgi:hypothetical protein
VGLLSLFQSNNQSPFNILTEKLISNSWLWLPQSQILRQSVPQLGSSTLEGMAPNVFFLCRSTATCRKDCVTIFFLLTKQYPIYEWSCFYVWRKL